jgi:PAS domain S-box-containing protein
VADTARRLAEAAATAEREAEHAREAAAQAEQAAGVARQAADEAGASAHRTGEGLRVISRFEAHGGSAHPAAGGNGAPPLEAAPEPLKPRKPLFATRDTGPKRDPRPGFDDLKQPTAKIGLDGRFQELNEAFTDLVGYSESEFQQAIWPPVMDRANLDKHREQMKDMLAGKMDSAGVKTGYVHAQGLLVPVVGTLTLVRENGEPVHFLLETSQP